MDINLLPKGSRSSRVAVSRKAWLIGGIAVVMLVLAAGGVQGWLMAQKDKLTDELVVLHTQLQRKTASQQSTNTVKTHAQQLETLLTQKMASRISWDLLMKDLNAALAPGMTVDTLQTTTGSLEITGKSPSVAAVAVFEQHLKQIHWVKSMALQSLALATDTKPPILVRSVGKSKHGTTPYAYSMTVRLKPGNGGATT